MLHHSLILNYRNSQYYSITSERSPIPFIDIYSQSFLDVVVECNLEDSDHPDPTMMNVEIFSAERKTGEALVLKKVSRLVWKHHGDVKL